MAITTPGSRAGLCSSLAWKVPEAALRWKRRGVKLYFPGSGRKRMRDVKVFNKKKKRRKNKTKTEPRCEDAGCTLQHAVVGLPVHLAQSRPELCRLRSLLHQLHLQAAAAVEAQLWWTPDGQQPMRSGRPPRTASPVNPVFETYALVRRSTVLLPTSLGLVRALQPVQRYSTPCWLLNRTAEPLDLRPAQPQSTSSREPSSGSSPRTQNKRHSAAHRRTEIFH